MGSRSTADLEVELPEIDRDELRRRLNDPSLTIVNVLPPEAYRAGHIPGSINLPAADIPQRAVSVLPDRNREIVVYCATDT